MGKSQRQRNLESIERNNQVRMDIAVPAAVKARLMEFKDRNPVTSIGTAIEMLLDLADQAGLSRLEEEKAAAIRLYEAAGHDESIARKLLKEEARTVNPAFDWVDRGKQPETPEQKELRLRCNRIRKHIEKLFTAPEKP